MVTSLLFDLKLIKTTSVFTTKYHISNYFQIRCNIFCFNLLINRAEKTIVSRSCVRRSFHLRHGVPEKNIVRSYFLLS